MADLAPLDIRTLDPDDLDQLADLSAQSFGGSRRDLAADTMAMPTDDIVGAYRGRRLVGTTAIHRFEQWFGGRPVPCGGIAGVTLAPDQRGAGISRLMLAAAAENVRAHDEPISALYPTTASLYRSVGYEIAGWWGSRAVPVADLPQPTGAVVWEPVEPSDPAIAEVAAASIRNDGWVLPSPRWWRAWATRRTEKGATTWTWLGRREGEPVAFVSYGHGDSDRALFDLDVDVILGVDGPALTDALALLGANGTTGDRVVTTLPGTVLARHVRQGSHIPTGKDWPWMVRIVDLPGAVAARGWPSGVTLEVDLRVAPPSHVPDDAVAGDWVLRVADGVGSCTPGGSGAVTVASTDLASLYTGHLDPALLASEGALAGATEAQASALRAAFSGSPSLPMFF